MAKAKCEKASKETAAARLWLHYYNKMLYEQGVISEHERNKMALRIDGWADTKRKR